MSAVDKPSFRGDGYDIAQDHKRLSNQNERVLRAMLDHKWHTLGELEELVHAPQPSISAQLRHLRRAEFGKHIIEKQRRGFGPDGLWEYRIPPPQMTFEQHLRAQSYNEGGHHLHDA